VIAQAEHLIADYTQMLAEIERDGRLRRFRRARTRFAGVLRSLPDQETEQGAADELVTELAFLADHRKAATSELM
jgi:hypothetical protein